MAATQTNLHQYFKARKSAREKNSIKNVKKTIVSDGSENRRLLGISRRKEVESVEEDRPGVLGLLVSKPLAHSQDQLDSGLLATRTSAHNRSQPKDGLLAPRTSTHPLDQSDGGQLTTRTSTHHHHDAPTDDDQSEAEENSCTPTRHLKVEESETLPLTPKRKRDEDEETKRKKRKQVEENDGSQTPKDSESRISVHPQTAPRSAKKRLIMGSEGEETTATSIIKKLTPEEIKGHLGKCGRLDELRAKLLKVNQCAEKLRQFKESAVDDPRLIEPPSPRRGVASLQLEKFTSLDVEVLVSPQKTPVKTPCKTPVKTPACERYRHLVEKPSEELVLPFKYRFVKEVFRAVDTVVSLLHNRQEVITYSKLKPAVQEMLRRTLHERHLGQIKTVFPLAYIFKQECNKNKINAGTRDGSKNSYELSVAANLDYKPASTQNLTKKFDSILNPQTPKFRKMDSIVLVERRNIFHNSLVGIVQDHHDHFLQSLDPPIMNSSGMNIKRWHPAFPLEDVPDIEPSALPQPPITEKFETARDILDKAQDLFSVNSRLERAVVEAAAKTPVKVDAKSQTAPSSQPADITAALKGVSSSLLEKIRAREAAKSARDMMRSRVENKELEMLSRLPEISRIIRNIFITEKKAALPWELVAAKVAASYTSMIGGSEVDNHLHLLIKEIPGFCTIHKVRSGTFLKINKNEQLSCVMDKLQAIIKQRR
ncbi:DNA replication factor Cdt1 [Panulirus ornatus]|uniref:DNA replication factor Cdt1 n=1 Tax=Panulirus ornatus TaxID=150431 RepID=UPI003A8580D9